MARTPEDGEQIRGLVRQTGMDLADLDIDWSDIYPYWVVAEQDDLIVGAMQVSPGKPVGRMEMMCIELELGHRTRGEIVKKLIEHGEQVLKAHGCRVNASMVAFADKGFKRAMQKRGYRTVLTGNTLGKVL